MRWYWVRLPKSTKKSRNVTIHLRLGEGTNAALRFNLFQVDKSQTDYPSKRLYISDENVAELKNLGFDVRKAKPPTKAPSTGQYKPAQLRREKE